MIITNPLDTVRIRWQVSQKAYTEKSVRSFGARVIAEEGLVTGLWLPAIGTNAAFCSIAVGIRLGLYPTIRDTICASIDSKSPGVMFASGLVSGACAYFCGSPLYMMKNRLQSEAGLKSADGIYLTGVRNGKAPSYRNGAHGLVSIAKSEGILGLWRGSGVLVARGATLNSSQLTGYDGTKRFCKANGLLEDGTALHVTASVVGALFLTTCVMPLDVLLTRYQTAQNVAGKDFAGPLSCAAQLFRDEGPRVFFRGWGPMFCRMLPSSLVTFLLYENIRSAAGIEFS